MSTENKEASEEKSKSAQTASGNSANVDAIKKELEEKLALEQELAKAKSKAKETEAKLNETGDQLKALSQQFEELKKKSMSKEELEASEKKQLAEENAKLKEKVNGLETNLKQKGIEITRIKVAHEENLPADVADLVIGDSEEEIRAKAKKLAAHIKANRTAETVTTNKVKEVGTETGTKEGVQPQAQQTGNKRPQSFAEAKQALYKKFSG